MKTQWGQTLAEIAPVKWNMLLHYAGRGKRGRNEGGRRWVWKVLCCSTVPGELWGLAKRCVFTSPVSPQLLLKRAWRGTRRRRVRWTERQPARRLRDVHQGQFFNLSKPARGMKFTRLVLLSKHFQSGSFVLNIVTEDVCLTLMISQKRKNNFPEWRSQRCKRFWCSWQSAISSSASNTSQFFHWWSWKTEVRPWQKKLIPSAWYEDDTKM